MKDTVDKEQKPEGKGAALEEVELKVAIAPWFPFSRGHIKAAYVLKHSTQLQAELESVSSAPRTTAASHA